jgi:methionyl-tRNA formyltransferase
MRIIFLGTPQFAVPTLETLAASGHEMVAVYTQPDRPKGRGNMLTQSPVKESANRLGLTLFQPERIRRPENVATLSALNPNLIVVVGFGQIIPKSIIDIPMHGILNVHASLLPKYRGAAPIQWAIANGEHETGITIMRIDEGLDTGDIVLQWHTPIGPHETAPELSVRLAAKGAELLVQAVAQIAAGTAEYRKQNDAEASQAPILKKEDGQILWTRSAKQIYDRFRGFTRWPGAYTFLRKRNLQVWKASVNDEPLTGSPGTLHVMNRRCLVVCGDNSTLELLELQLEGKKRMATDAFLNGYTLASGEILGEHA